MKLCSAIVCLLIEEGGKRYTGEATREPQIPSTDFSVVLVTLLVTQLDHSRFAKCGGDTRRQANT